MARERDDEAEDFFRSLCAVPAVKAALDGGGFSEPEVKSERQNWVLVISKSDWITPQQPGQEKRVRIHYEARGKTPRGQFRLEVELFKYPKPREEERMKKLGTDPWRSAYVLKADLTELLRSKLLDTPDLRERFGISAEHQFPPREDSTQTAVTLNRGLPRDCSVEAAAAFLCEILRDLTPHVDRLVHPCTRPRGQVEI
jgi:hypothetical protein